MYFFGEELFCVFVASIQIVRIGGQLGYLGTFCSNLELVGGFNPTEKYDCSQIGSFPKAGVNMKNI